MDHAIKQKHAEKILEQERQQLLSIFDSLDQVVYVSDPKTYEILYVNKNFQNFLGHDALLAGSVMKSSKTGKHPVNFAQIQSYSLKNLFLTPGNIINQYLTGIIQSWTG